MMTRLAIAGYRSLRDIRVPIGALNVVTGANGSGKSSLYRALRLLADIAQGRIIQSNRLWLCHRSWPAVAGFAFEIFERPGNQGRKPMDR
jgi:AAA15 family ATPase/GTPase